MANENVLGTLFGNIANAIREKTGGTETMKPNDFPVKIRSISVGPSGDVSGELVVGESAFFYGFGTFTPSGNTYTVQHGLGHIPDVAVVFADHDPEEGFLLSALGARQEVQDYLLSNGGSAWTGYLSSCLREEYEYFTSAGIDNTNVVMERHGSIRAATNSYFTVGGIGDIINADGVLSLFSHKLNPGKQYRYMVFAGKMKASGGYSADVRYVSFKSHDGAVEYGKKAVAVGDDCADPIARGIFSTPTRESDVQYDYTFAGWASTPNGGLDANWNKAVQSNKSVYANFAGIVRSYTISYYDGETLLHTQQVNYGAVPPLYTPEKEGLQFDGWDRELEAVTGDTAYYAQWTEVVTFANASWSKISEICEAGQASSMFAINDEKEIASADGTEIFALRIIGFDMDAKADGSGNAGITVAVTKRNKVAVTQMMFDADAKTNVRPYWQESDVYIWLTQTFVNMLPSEVSQQIKPVTKVTGQRYNVDGYKLATDTTTETLFIPSYQEMVGANWQNNDNTNEASTKYPGMDANNERVLYDADGKAISWWHRCSYTSNMQGITSADGNPYSYPAGYYSNMSSESSEAIGVYPCFCI